MDEPQNRPGVRREGWTCWGNDDDRFPSAVRGRA